MTDRAEILRPVIQAAFDEGGLDAVVEVVCAIIAEIEARIKQHPLGAAGVCQAL